MKKILNVLTSTALFTLISINYASGQDVASSNKQLSSTNHTPASGIIDQGSSSAVTANVNPKAIADFQKSYKVQPVWSFMEGSGYMASFADGEVQNCVYYDKKGNRTCNLKRYDESKMSRELRRIVKPVYYDYSILGITEIAVPGNSIHLVYLSENASNFKTVRVSNGEMEVIEWIQNGKFVKL